MRKGLIAIIFFISLLCVISLFNYSEAKFGLNITSHANPDSVNTDQNITLSISISNEGSKPVHINSVSLISPDWESTTYYGDHFKTVLDVNRTNIIKIEVKPNLNTTSGKYFLEVLTSTTGRDYFTGSEVNVNGFDGIPLSGNVPLFIFVILSSGLVTYASGSYLLIRKVDFSFLQVSILSVGLGLLNWLVIGLIGWAIVGVPLYFFPIQSIHNNPAGIGYLLLAGAIIGSGFGFGVGYYKKRKDRKRQERERDEKAAQFQTELRRKGYADPEEKVWISFLKDVLNVALQRLGKGYTLLLKVYLKQPLENQEIITGLLWHFEKESPYDIVLRPKYVFYVNNLRQILDILTIDSPSSAPYSTTPDPSPLINSLRNDKEYRNKIVKYYLRKNRRDYSRTDEIMNQQIVIDVRLRLTQAMSQGTL